MKDTKKKSASEAIANILVGYPISHVSNILILLPFAPAIAESATTNGAFGWETQLWLGAMGAFYTVFSFGRQYLLRRLFLKMGYDEDLGKMTLRGCHWLRSKLS